MISIVFGYRNRDLKRVQRCLDSLKKQSCDKFEVLFVDYGSDKKQSEAARRLIGTYSFASYLYTDTRGYPWSRSKALNIGIKRAKYDYVFTNDVDMLFPSNVVENLIGVIDDRHVFHVPANFLEKDFNAWDRIDEINLGGYDGTGRGIMVIPRKQLVEIRGYDEYYFFWGSEDMDLSDRLTAKGIIEKKLPENIFLHHQWHPTSYDNQPSFFNPDWEGRMENYRRREVAQLERNSENWGRIIESKDRKCWDYIDDQTYSITKYSNNVTMEIYPREYFVQTDLVNLFHDTTSGQPLIIHHANYPTSFSLLKRALLWVNRAVFQKFRVPFGLQIANNTLHQFIYELISTNLDGIEDYFLDVNESRGSVWILKK